MVALLVAIRRGERPSTLTSPDTDFHKANGSEPKTNRASHGAMARELK